MNIKDFAEKFINAEKEAFQKGNFEPLKALEDPNLVYHAPFGIPDMVGHEAHKQSIIGLREAWSDFKQEFEYLAGDGSLFVLSYKSSARVTGTYPGSTIPVGKKVSSDEI